MAISFNRIAPDGRSDWLRYLLLLGAVVVITLLIPKRGRFRYEYELNQPWRHDDLIAPFDFAVLKSPQALEAERLETERTFHPFYARHREVTQSMKDSFSRVVAIAMRQENYTPNRRKYMLSKGLRILDDFYDRGIIERDTAHKDKPGSFIINELTSKISKERLLSEYYTPSEARQTASEIIKNDSLINVSWFRKALVDAIQPNIRYDRDLSEKNMKELLDAIPPTRGMRNQGDLLLRRGQMVDEADYMVLESLRREFEGQLGDNSMVYLGYFLLVFILFFIFSANLELFREHVVKELRSLILILINILLFTILTAYMTTYDVGNVYIIPYCIVPIVLLTFFGVRVALLTHLVVVLLCGLMVPNAYEFVLIETLAGFAAVLSMAKLRYISQFFVSALLIFMTYAVVYFGLNFIKSANFEDVEWQPVIWFGGNFLLTLIAYPLIYVNEKIFGFLSDISLLELADINNKLLKQLFTRAPGTFQHSLQVANLSEAVIDRIGGNALLTRVGALYHDIGKMEAPEFFIENQKYATSPHEQLNEKESAEIIIGHVTKGVEMAQEYGLPKAVVDFIRTHHGTTRVDFFYRNWLQKHPEDEGDDSAFRYPGPKPFSKETAVVMICDSVEAASRSLKEPDEKALDLLVDRIVDAKIQDNQFDYANITIHDINTARRVLKKLLKSIYHIRIQYPGEAKAKNIAS